MARRAAGARATHGPANDRNAHPHVSSDGQVAVVHNGVIENYSLLKRQLIEDGIEFHSDTDTEVIAHLIAKHLTDDLVDAVRKTLQLLKGTYGLAVVSRRHPDMLVGYNQCRVSYVTHAINGLSTNDFICAAKLDALFAL